MGKMVEVTHRSLSKHQRNRPAIGRIVGFNGRNGNGSDKSNNAKARAEAAFKAAASLAISPEPTATVLADQIPQPKPAPAAGEIGLSLSKNGKASVALRFSIPSALLGEIGDPKRVRIDGTVHEGFTIVPDPDDGLLISYVGGFAGGFGYVAISVTDRGIKDKTFRRMIKLAAVVKDNTVALSGPPQDWIAAAPAWRREPDSRNEARRLPANAYTGNAIAPPAAPPIAATGPKIELRPGETVATLKARLQQTLAEAGILKAELEQRTGLEFRITATLGLLVK